MANSWPARSQYTILETIAAPIFFFNESYIIETKFSPGNFVVILASNNLPHSPPYPCAPFEPIGPLSADSIKYGN